MNPYYTAAEEALMGCGYPIMVRRTAGDWDALSIAQIIVDEVEPLIRADERRRLSGVEDGRGGRDARG